MDIPCRSSTLWYSSGCFCVSGPACRGPAEEAIFRCKIAGTAATLEVLSCVGVLVPTRYGKVFLAAAAAAVRERVIEGSNMEDMVDNDDPEMSMGTRCWVRDMAG